jgi:hypothetical protein
MKIEAAFLKSEKSEKQWLRTKNEKAQKTLFPSKIKKTTTRFLSSR